MKSYPPVDLPLQKSHQNKNSIQPLSRKTKIYKNFLLPYTINERNKLDPKVRRINLNKNLLCFVRPTQNKTFGV